MTALGAQLVEIHHALTEQLNAVQEDVGAFARGGPRPRDLRTHCLAFCSTLGGHHTREDGGMFPALVAQFPDLAPAIEKLRQDHEMIATLLQTAETVVRELPENPDPADADRVLRHLDGLSAIMESHFRYEERSLVETLNSVGAPPD